MKVLYDGYIFSAQHAGGISRYFTNIFKRLPPQWTPVVRLNGDAENVRALHPRLKVEALALIGARPQFITDHLSNKQAELLDSVTRYDLCHPTYYFRLPERFVRKGRRPLVATVHDLILERYAKQLDPTGVEMLAKRRMIESADAIICVSENTKRELQEHYHVPDDRITITFLAAGLDSSMVASSGTIPERPYVLFLGNRGLYKNFARTLIAFAKIRNDWPGLILRVVGDRLNMQELELISALQIEGRVQQVHWRSDSDLATLYHFSQALIYPSLHEGFGIPPLEAMACGTVVICSNTTSLPEVVGDAAIQINPKSIGEIAEALLSLKDMGGKRQDLIRRGFDRATKFSWDTTAKQTVELYKAVA